MEYLAHKLVPNPSAPTANTPIDHSLLQYLFEDNANQIANLHNSNPNNHVSLDIASSSKLLPHVNINDSAVTGEPMTFLLESSSSSVIIHLFTFRISFSGLCYSAHNRK